MPERWRSPSPPPTPSRKLSPHTHAAAYHSPPFNPAFDMLPPITNIDDYFADSFDEQLGGIAPEREELIYVIRLQPRQQILKSRLYFRQIPRPHILPVLPGGTDMRRTAGRYCAGA